MPKAGTRLSKAANLLLNVADNFRGFGNLKAMREAIPKGTKIQVKSNTGTVIFTATGRYKRTSAGGVTPTFTSSDDNYVRDYQTVANIYVAIPVTLGTSPSVKITKP